MKSPHKESIDSTYLKRIGCKKSTYLIDGLVFTLPRYMWSYIIMYVCLAPQDRPIYIIGEYTSRNGHEND